MIKTAAVILAGGKGTRMKSNISKQFIEINDKPIIYYSLKKFICNDNIDKVILVLPEDEIEYCRKNVIEKFNLKIDDIAIGGSERQESVYNGLIKADGCDIVLIHDGARPFVTDEIINKGIEYAQRYGAAAPGVMPKDTIKVRDDSGFSVDTPDRSKLISVQTPQCFKYEMIKECHRMIKKDGIGVTDDTMAAEMYGNKVYLYDGEYTNLKITTPEDLIIGEYLVFHSN